MTASSLGLASLEADWGSVQWASRGPQRVTRGTGGCWSLEPSCTGGWGGGTGHALCGGLRAERHSAHGHGPAPEGVLWKTH